MKKTEPSKEDELPKKYDAEMLVDALCGLATPEESDHVRSLLLAENKRLDGLKRPEPEKKSLDPDSDNIKNRSDRQIP